MIDDCALLRAEGFMDVTCPEPDVFVWALGFDALAKCMDCFAVGGVERVAAAEG